MNATPFFFFLLLLSSFLPAQSDVEQVEAVLNDYINGTAYNISEKIARAFHPESNLYLTKNEDELRIVPSKEYAAYFKEENRSKFNGRVGKVISIDLHRDIAYAKAEILMPARKFRFIDMFLLKKNEGRWSIIGKTASGQPSEAQEVDRIFNQSFSVNQYDEANDEQLLYDQPSFVERQMDSIFRSYDNAKTPGVAVGVVHRGKLIFSKGFGMANLTYGIPVTEHSVFPLGSASKQFTVMAMMLLAEAGKLSLDDDVHQHLPELPDYGEVVTLRQLANHTGGVRSDLIMMGMAGINPDDAVTHRAALEMMLRQKELNTKPGNEFSYSNGGYTLLAEIIERVSGVSFAAFMQAEIFEPLGMENTLVLADYESIVKRLAESYTPNEKTYAKEVMSYSLLGSTGVMTTVRDLNKWFLNFREPIIGNMDFFREMETPAILNNGITTQAGLGQFIGQHRGATMIHHGGATAGYRTNLVRFPDQDISIMVLSNNGGSNCYNLSLSVADVFFDLFGVRELLAQKEELTPVIKLSNQALKSFTGNYLHTTQGFKRELLLRGDQLIYSRLDQNGRESELSPVASNRFRLQVPGNVEVVFDSEKYGADMVVLVDGTPEEYYDQYEQFVPNSEDLAALTGTYFSEELATTYRLVLESGVLSVNHPRLGVIPLSPLNKEKFLSNGWQFNTLQLELDEQAKVTGFRISSGRSRNILFVKN